MSTRRQRLYLIDASGYVYRAFHALPPLSTSRGVPTNAVLGFARMVAKLLRQERPDYVAVVFDAGGRETFRDALYEGYKASRRPTPAELRAQLPYLRRLVEALRLPVLAEPGVEADDVIGTLAAQAEAAGLETVIVTGDKDMMQLVTERTSLYDTMHERRIGPAEVCERLGVEPAQVPEVLGLMGDPSDDIPGVRGIGEKTAVALVRRFGTVDRLLQHLDELATSGIRGAQRVREALERDAAAARLSAELARIRRDVPVRLDLEGLRWAGPDRERLRALLAELEMFSLLRELGGESALPLVAIARADDAPATEAALRGIAAAPAVAIVAQFASPRPTTARLEAIAVAGPADPVVLVTTPEAPGVLAALAPLAGDLAVQKLGADLKALRVAFARRGLTLASPAIDVALASYCLDPSRSDHSPAALAEVFLGQPRPAATDADSAICAAARSLHALTPVLLDRLRSEGLEPLFRDLEMPLAEVLAEMELAGIALDVEALAQLSGELAERLDALMSEIHALAGGPFNIGSPAQLRTVLFERLGLSTRGIKRGKTGLSTDVDVLTRLAREHPLPAKILEWRQLAKLKTTYVDALPALVDPVTGRLHTCFNQTVAVTGRLSSSDPNLQNIPVRSEVGRRIRAAFVAAPGWRLISADYSQIELRVLAHLANDAALCAAFARGDDIHAATAAAVFSHLPPAEGRRMAKVMNYGIVYGMGAARAAREMNVSVAEAESYIAQYLDRYPGVRAFMQRSVQEAYERGWVATVLGRRRYLPELRSADGAVRQFAERAAINTPIQGSAADLIKLAMLHVRQRLASADLRARLLLQVHDELVIEAPHDEAERAARLVQATMEAVWPLAVPLRVDVRIGSHWAEVH